MNYTIYAIYNNNNLLYIGSTKNYIKRIITHNCNIKYNNSNSKIKLYSHIKENNLDIHFKPLLVQDNITKNEIAFIENNYIDKFKPLLNSRKAIINSRFKMKDYQTNYYYNKKYVKKEITEMLNINY